MRKNTLMVLTHLILNDMVKVKGQISEMAVCIEDKDQRISDLARSVIFSLSLSHVNLFFFFSFFLFSLVLLLSQIKGIGC